jgi:hypothetical protein
MYSIVILVRFWRNFNIFDSFEKHSNIKFHANPSSGSRVPCGGKDRLTDGQTWLLFATLWTRLKMTKVLTESPFNLFVFSVSTFWPIDETGYQQCDGERPNAFLFKFLQSKTRWRTRVHGRGCWHLSQILLCPDVTHVNRCGKNIQILKVIFL